MLKISLITRCKQFSIGSIQILPRFSIYKIQSEQLFTQVSVRWI